MRFRNALLLALTAALIMALPWFGRAYLSFVLCTVAVYFIVALALNLLVAQAGQISIGHAAFWALGAYGTAILVTKLNLPFVVGVLGGGAVAGLLGALVAIPALRLQGHYLAIATLGFALFIQQVLHEWEGLTGGRAGMFVPRPELGGYELSSDIQYYYLLVAVCIVLAWMSWNLNRSRTGRALMALRMSSTAAASCGINRTRSLITVFALSAFLTGISGALYAHLVGYLSVSTFTLGTSLSFLTMIVVGGIGRLSGALAGALFLTLAPEYLREFGDAQMVLYGLILVLVMLFLPGGIVSLPQRLREATGWRAAGGERYGGLARLLGMPSRGAP
ncbi:MAG: branched-chain amino acid ABC transporter permease [Pseudomonadota bacterium]